MTATDIVELALACYRTPLACQDRLSLAVPLPEGMNRLLWLANGAPQVLDVAARQTGAKPQELRDAARFCIQQWCLVRGADPHRVLGVEPGAPLEQVRKHYRLLMRLFHPDRAAGRESWTDHYASQVNEAWTALSRPQSRVHDDDQPDQPPRSPEPMLVPPAAKPSATGLVPSRNGRQRPRKGRLPGWWFAAPRRGLPVLALAGFALAAVLVAGGIHLFEPHATPAGSPATAPGPAKPSVAGPDPVTTEPAERSAIAALQAAPDWQALEQREHQARQQFARARETRGQWEETRRQQLAAEQALLEQMRVERARLEEQVKIEQARIERMRAERLAVEQQQLARLPAGQARPDAMANHAPPAGQHDLTAAELESLISRYTHAYQRGDLSGVMALFASGARDRIQQDYAKLFATYYIRGLWLRDLRWLYHGPSASGSGRYELRLRRRDNGELHRVEGSVRFTVQKRDSQVLIEVIEYKWPGT